MKRLAEAQADEDDRAAPADVTQNKRKRTAKPLVTMFTMNGSIAITVGTDATSHTSAGIIGYVYDEIEKALNRKFEVQVFHEDCLCIEQNPLNKEKIQFRDLAFEDTVQTSAVSLALSSVGTTG